LGLLETFCGSYYEVVFGVFVQKFAEHQNLANLVARLQAKCTEIEKALVRCTGDEMMRLV